MTDLPVAAIRAGTNVLLAQGWLREEFAEPEAEHATKAVLTAAIPHLVPALESEQLSEAEKRAAQADLHMATCSLPLVACVRCLAELSIIRKVLKAAGPVIERAAREDERYLARQAAERFEPAEVPQP